MRHDAEVKPDDVAVELLDRCKQCREDVPRVVDDVVRPFENRIRSIIEEYHSHDY
jgi:hypothetical protein